MDKLNATQSNSQEQDVCFLGTVELDNVTKSFGLLAEDRRRHVYIIGKSGVGKSTLIENMVMQDIYAGHGVAFLDPLGDSAESILDRIPGYRQKDVIYFNPADLDNPVGFNMLEVQNNEPNFLLASGIMSILKKIWADSFSSRMEYILNNTVLALLEMPGNNLLGIIKMLTDGKFRKFIADNIENIMVKNFWLEEFPKFSPSYITEAVAPIINKVGQFTSNDMLRNIFGQAKSTINFREIMDKQKILIVNLSKGRMGEDNSNLLGSMIVTKLQLAAMSRVDTPEPERKDFYFYADEFQNLINESFATILSEARKYRLNLTVAHQYIAQLVETDNERIKNAVFGNVGTIITFQIGSEDSEIFAKEMFPTLKDVNNYFLDLDRGQVLIKLFVQSRTIAPFIANTLPPLYTEFKGSRNQVVALSRKQYSRNREEVEQEIYNYFVMNQIPDESGGVIIARKKRKKPPVQLN